MPESLPRCRQRIRRRHRQGAGPLGGHSHRRTGRHAAFSSAPPSLILQCGGHCARLDAEVSINPMMLRWAGGLAAIATTPADVVKTRIMTSAAAQSVGAGAMLARPGLTSRAACRVGCWVLYQSTTGPAWVAWSSDLQRAGRSTLRWGCWRGLEQRLGRDGCLKLLMGFIPSLPHARGCAGQHRPEGGHWCAVQGLPGQGLLDCSARGLQLCGCAEVSTAGTLRTSMCGNCKYDENGNYLVQKPRHYCLGAQAMS